MDLRPFENISVSLFCLMCTVIVIYYLRLRHKERMERIKLREIDTVEDLPANPNSLLGKAIVALSLAVGLVGGLLLSLNYPGLPSAILYLICLLFCGGAGLLVYYFIASRAD